MTKMRAETMALLAILAVAAIVRIIGLDAGLWYDEVFTLTHYVRAPLPQLLTDFSSLNNHMFYSLQAKGAVALFGEHPWVLRLPAMLFGLASLVVLWRLAREPAGRRATFFALLLLAISYHHVWFSQNARGYTGILFWTSLATLCLVEGLKRPGWRTWSLYGACVAAGMYTHLSAGFFFASHALVYGAAWLGHRAGRLPDYPGLDDIRPVFGFALGGLLTALLHAPLFAQVLAAMNRVSEGKDSSAMAEWVNPLRTLQEIVASLDALGPLAPVALGVALVALVTGMLALWRKAPLLVGVYALSVPLALVLLVLLDFRIWPRYFFVDIGFVYLCLAVGAERLCRIVARAIRLPKLETPFLIAGVLVATAGSLVLLKRNYEAPKQDFDGAMNLIAGQRRQGDIATSLGLASEPLRSYFAPGWPVVAKQADLAAIESSARRVWLVTAFDDHVEHDQQAILAHVERSYVLVRAFDGTLGGGTVKVYRLR